MAQSRFPGSGPRIRPCEDSRRHSGLEDSTRCARRDRRHDRIRRHEPAPGHTASTRRCDRDRPRPATAARSTSSGPAGSASRSSRSPCPTRPAPDGHHVAQPAGASSTTPRTGLGPDRRACRRCALPWIRAAATSAEHEGRPVSRRDDGRAAVRRGEPAPADAFPPSGRGRCGPTGRPVTQLHYARRGEVTPEMASWPPARGCPASWCGTRSPPAGPSCRPTSTTPSPSRWSSAPSSW